MSDITDIYAAREKEYAGLRAIHERGQRRLTGRETDMVVAWARASMRHEPLDPARNTPSVKRETVKAFDALFNESAPKKKLPQAKRPPAAVPPEQELEILGHEILQTVREAHDTLREAVGPLARKARNFWKKNFG